MPDSPADNQSPRACACGQAIYPVLIIVIVALNWSPIEHGLTEGTRLEGEDAGCQPTRVTLNRATTMSTVVIAGETIQMRCIQSGEDSAPGADMKRGSTMVV